VADVDQDVGELSVPLKQDHPRAPGAYQPVGLLPDAREMLLRFAHFRNACKPGFPHDGKGVRDRRARRSTRLYRGRLRLYFVITRASAGGHESREHQRVDASDSGHDYGAALLNSRRSAYIATAAPPPKYSEKKNQNASG